jgi:hypothetical protein
VGRGLQVRGLMLKRFALQIAFALGIGAVLITALIATA